MTSHRLTLKLSLLGVGIVSACSLTVPSEDEVFSNGGSSSDAGSPSGAVSGSGNASNGGDPAVEGGAGSSAIAGGGQSTGGTGAKAGSGGEAGVVTETGGAGGAPPEPQPTGELVNPSFEGSLNGWTISPKTPAIFIQYTGAAVTAVDGGSVLSGWYPKEGQEAYATRVFQVVKGLEDGTYRLSAQIAAKIGIPSAKIYATNCGGTDPEPVAASADAWHEVAIEAVEVVGGECEVGFDIDSRILDWVNIDAVELKKVEPK